LIYPITGKPQTDRPRVVLARIVGLPHQRNRTLIGLASRALYLADRRDEAEALRAHLLAADPRDHLRILRASVDFWPAQQAERFPVGDPARHWASAPIAAEDAA
jgi:hypothetical protein